MANYPRKLNTLGISKSRGDVGEIVNSTGVIIVRRDSDPIGAIKNGQVLNDYILVQNKVNTALRSRLASLENDIKILKEFKQEIINERNQ